MNAGPESSPRPEVGANGSQHHWLAGMLGLAVLCLLPWSLYLHVTLPTTYTATHWARTWIGFDSCLVVALATTAYLASRARPSFPTWATISATILICDAWFDVTTATAADLPASVLAALVLELPMAGLLYGSVKTVRHHAQPHVVEDVTANIVIGTVPSA